MSRMTIRERRLISGLGAVLCVVGAGLLYLKSAADSTAWAEGRYVNADGVVEPSRAQKEADRTLTVAATEKARHFREKFRPWALRHRVLIQKMLDAGPADMAARGAVYDALPMNAMEAGFGRRDFYGSAKPPFAWGGAGKRLTDNHPDVQAHIRKSPRNAKLWKMAGEYARKKAPQDFAEFRDLQIATSVNSGRYTMTLWVSGRITKTYYTGRPSKPGRVGLDVVVTEVAPPYDFLQPRVLFDKDAEFTPEK